MSTKINIQKSSKVKYLRIPLDNILTAKIRNKQKELPLLDDVEIVKIFLSKGIVEDYKATIKQNVDSIINLLEKQEKDNKLIAGLSEEEQYQLLKNNDLL